MRQRKQPTWKHRYRVYLISSGLSLLLAGCSAGVVLALAALVGFYLGTIKVTFPADSPTVTGSDTTGEARLELETDAQERTTLRSYEGMLPGLTEMGAAQAVVELDTGEVTGTITTPEGEEFDLRSVLPGLSATRNEGSPTAQVASDELGFTLGLEDAGISFTYRMAFNDLETSDDGETFKAGVTVDRRVVDNGEVALDDTGDGTISAEREVAPRVGRPAALPPPRVPVFVTPPRNVIYEHGSDPITLGVTIRPPDTGQYHYQWSPATHLDNANILQPKASPPHNTTLTLLVMDAPTMDEAVFILEVMVPVTVPLRINRTWGDVMTVCEGTVFELPVKVVGGPSGPVRFSFTEAGEAADDEEQLGSETTPFHIAGAYDTSTWDFTAGNTKRLVVSVFDTSLALLASATMDVTVVDSVSPPQVSLPAEVTYDTTEPVSLSPSVTGGGPPYEYSWSPTTGLSDATISNPTAAVEEDTAYTLTVTDICGGTGTATVLVRVTEPDGDDETPGIDMEGCPIPDGAEYWWSLYVDGTYHEGYKTETIVYVGPYRTWASAEKTHLKHEACRDENGDYHGWFRNFHDNGAVSLEMEYERGVREGVRREYYENTELKVEEYYVNNELSGERWTYYEDGDKESLTRYIAGLKNGIAETWYTDMRPKSRIAFVDNVLHGIYLEWYEDGSVKTDCDTENGEFVVCR